MNEKNKIGAKIKQLRKSKEFDINELSVKSSVSQDIISQIEDGEIVPSLNPLIKLARALGVRLGTFLDDAPQSGPVLVENGKSKQVVYFSGEENQTDLKGLEFNSLAADKIDRHMEPFLIDVDSKKSDHELSSHEGEEFIYVLDGDIELQYGQDSYNLSKGDSIYYDSIVPHHLHSNGNNSKILAVIYTPI
ncbi:MAG: helix-turn-helix domain-containing protein [Methanobacteriaceae archaeon]